MFPLACKWWATRRSFLKPPRIMLIDFFSLNAPLLASVNPHTRALPWLAAPHSILLVPLSRPCVPPCRHLATTLHTRDHAALATSSNCLATFTDLAPIKDVPYPEYRLSPATLPLPMTTTSRCYITLHRPRLHPFPGWRPRRRPLLLGPVTQHGMTPFRA